MNDLTEFIACAGLGVLIALPALVTPSSTKALHAIRIAIGATVVAYPLGIAFLACTRGWYGESYGWIILGDLWSYLAGGLLIAFTTA